MFRGCAITANIPNRIYLVKKCQIGNFHYLPTTYHDQISASLGIIRVVHVHMHEQ